MDTLHCILPRKAETLSGLSIGFLAGEPASNELVDPALDVEAHLLADIVVEEIGPPEGEPECSPNSRAKVEAHGGSGFLLAG